MFGIDDAIGAIGNIVGKAMDHWLPKSMDEKEKEEIKLKAQVWVMEHGLKEDQSFRDFIVQYEGAAKDAGWLITFVRGMIRPTLTVVVTAAYIWGWLHPEKWTPEQMIILKPALLVVLIFWFGDKALQKSGLLDSFRKK